MQRLWTQSKCSTEGSCSSCSPWLRGEEEALERESGGLYHESLGHRASLHPSTWPSHKAVAAPEAGSTAGGCELCSETRGVFPKCQALLTTAEHRPGASPSEAYGAFTKCPLVARCRLEAGGQG